MTDTTSTRPQMGDEELLKKPGDPQRRRQLACMGTVDLISYAVKLENRLSSDGKIDD